MTDGIERKGCIRALVWYCFLGKLSWWMISSGSWLIETAISCRFCFLLQPDWQSWLVFSSCGVVPCIYMLNIFFVTFIYNDVGMKLPFSSSLFSNKLYYAFLGSLFWINMFFILWGQLFSQRDSLLKSPSVRCTKDSKPSYCLACLFSLVEQVTSFTKPDIYIYNLLNNLCFLIKSCQLMVTLWSLLSSLFHRQDICSSGNGPWNGAGAGIFTHLYLCLKDTTGHWSAIQNILRTFFCILTWVGRWWKFIFIWMQNCAGTSWIWLCNILFWAGRFVTTWLADQALGDYHEAY